MLFNLQPEVTLIFGIMTPRVGRFMPLTHGIHVPIGIKIGTFVIKIPCSHFLWRTNGRTDWWRNDLLHVSNC